MRHPVKKKQTNKYMLEKLGRLRLGYLVAGAVIWTFLIVKGVAMIPEMFEHRKNSLRDAVERTSIAVKANIDPKSFPTVQDLHKFGRRLMQTGTIRGGAILNAAGEELSSFGERPALTYSAVKNDGITEYHTRDGSAIDLFFTSEQLGIANPLVMRVDTTSTRKEMAVFIKNHAFQTLFEVIVSAAGVVLLLNFWITRPILKMQKATMKAMDDPDNADHHALHWSRRDELGEMSRTLDLLLSATSILHQDDLAGLQKAIDNTKIAVIHYNANGRIVMANKTALTMFGVNNMHDLAARNEHFLAVKSGREVTMMSPMQKLKDGPFVETLDIKAKEGDIRCLVDATITYKPNGDILRYCVNLVDQSKLHKNLNELEKKNKSLSEDNDKLGRKSEEMRRLFEGCLTLIQPHKSVAEGVPNRVLITDRIVNSWYTEAHDGRIVQGDLVHNILPNVVGPEEAVRDAFRQAMFVVQSRSQYVRPCLAVEATLASAELLRFEVRDVTDESGISSARRSAEEMGNWALPFAAFRSSITASSGKLISNENSPERNAIVFQLKAAPANAIPDEVKNHHAVNMEVA